MTYSGTTAEEIEGSIDKCAGAVDRGECNVKNMPARRAALEIGHLGAASRLPDIRPAF